MKKSMLLPIIFAIIVASATAIICSEKVLERSNPAPKSYSHESYREDWKSVDSLAKLGLSRSALRVVEKIYEKAKQEENAPQFVKAVIQKLKFESYIEDESFVKSIYKLSEEVKTAHYPIKPIMHSLLASLYWRYYQNNRWRFSDRTATVSFQKEDISTWDIKSLVEATIKHYTLSLKETALLKKTALNIYDEIIHVQDSTTRRFRPTLYDFLAHRAVDFYINEEHDVIKPAYTFELDNKNYLSPYMKFTKLTLSNKDPLSTKYHALEILQDLLKFHRSDKDPAALIDAELKRLKFVRAHAIFDNKDDLYLSSLKTLKKKFAKHDAYGEIVYEEALVHFQQGMRYRPLVSDTNKWGLKTAHELCQGLITKSKKETFGVGCCKHLVQQIQEKQLRFTVEKASVPQKDFRAFLTYRNLSTVYVRLLRSDPLWFNKVSQKYHGAELAKTILSQPMEKEWKISLVDDGDFQEHATEFRVPGLNHGFYILVVGSDKTFSRSNNAVNWTSMWVSNLSYIRRDKKKMGIEYYVLNRTTGKPMPAVSAQLLLQEYDYNKREYKYKKGPLYKTDKTGHFLIKGKNKSLRYFIKFAKGEDYLHSDNAYLPVPYKAPVKKVVKTVFFTDRAIYRPGQSVYFKGLILESENDKTTIKPKYKTTVTFYDANQQKVDEKTVMTNEYGTFHGVFTAPVGLLNGRMRITSKHGSHSIRVEEYKRPKFEVTLNPVKGDFQINDSVVLGGVAKAYAGSNIDNATFTYRVVRSTSFPFWCYWWRWYYPSLTDMEIAQGSGKTDEKGTFSFRFKAIPDHSIKKDFDPRFSYIASIDVTDINGETRSTQKSVTIGYTALNMEIKIPKELDRDSKEKFAIQTTNLDGQFQHSQGSIIINKLKERKRIFRKRLWQQPDKHLLSKEEYYKFFPHDLYADEDNLQNREKGKQVLNTEFNTKKDSLLSLKRLHRWEPGQYVLEAHTKDSHGKDVKAIQYFTLYAKQSNQVPTNNFAWVTTTKKEAEPGDTITALVGSAVEGVHMLYEVEHKGALVHKEWLTINNEQKAISIPVKETYRGNFTAHCTFVKENRNYQHDIVITVPYTNKKLDIEFSTFRDKLSPGQKETWSMKVNGAQGEKVVAELLAGMYDASLDAFVSHGWMLDLYKKYYSQLSWSSRNSFSIMNSIQYADSWNTYVAKPRRQYDRLKTFGYDLGQYIYDSYAGGGGYFHEAKGIGYAPSEMDGAPAPSDIVLKARGAAKFKSSPSAPLLKKSSTDLATNKKDLKSKSQMNELNKVQTRKNFNETAFFFPQLKTNAEGQVEISFTIPEALTRWKFLGFAHTKDLKFGMIEKEIVTQKELMVIPNVPRFLREMDNITLQAKISNLAKKDLSGKAQLSLFDAFTNKPIDTKLKNNSTTKPFTTKKGQSTVVSWDLQIPKGLQAVKYRIVVKSGSFSDGEEMVLPVLTNRILVTEALPLPIRGKQKKEYLHEKLVNSGSSKTLTHHKLTLEYTTNPAWYAIQALPYLMEYPYDCSEQIFSRFYANSIASHIATSNPRIKEVFETWKKTSPKALLSNLEKNQELKNLLLQETPWVLNGQDESQRKKNIGLLFDLNHMADELRRSKNALQKMQTSSGGWPWFPGMPESRYITQHIVTGIGHLLNLDITAIKKNTYDWRMVTNALGYLDDKMYEDYTYLLKHFPKELHKNHLGGTQIQYLYARSYFLDHFKLSKKHKKAFDYYVDQSKKYWLKNNRYLQGMLALTLHRVKEDVSANQIMKSLKENAIFSEELGMYWNDITSGYYWYQAPIETMALLAEAFDEVASDQKSVDAIKVWLLKNKQTNDWKTTKATSEACYALLLRGSEWLTQKPDVTIDVGENTIDPSSIPHLKAEAGSGYFTTSWTKDNIHPKLGKVTVKKSGQGVSWGALYWQYFEQLDKITPHKTPLSLKKKLFIKENSATGPVLKPLSKEEQLSVGDNVTVRMELRVDRDLEYVHIKDQRAACFEPINVISQYKYQDGLGYYESTKDASTNFFISFMPKGTYVFEYSLRVSHSGDFSNGITTMQCMYAPEFTTHSEGVRVTVGKQ